MKTRREDWFKENGPCRQCGSWEKLELDHINPAEKEHHCVWSWSAVRMKAELEKCQPLCHVCHKQKTINQLSKPIQHGTRNTYDKGCRCAPCRYARNDATRDYRLRTWGTTSSKPPGWIISTPQQDKLAA